MKWTIVLLATTPSRRFKQISKAVTPSILSSTPKPASQLVPSSTPTKHESIDEESDELGSNAQFRATPVDSKILEFIDTIGAGRRRRSERLKITRDKALSPDSELPKKQAEVVEKLFHGRLSFKYAADRDESLPPPGLPEIAFSGRSNVGKSSLLNALTPSSPAWVSEKPGFTRSINFYNLDRRLMLVDLPGYGFAFAKDEARESWSEFTKSYLTNRSSLKRVMVLIDSRHGLKQQDRETLEFLNQNRVSNQVVLTKTDLVDRIDLARRLYIVKQDISKLKYSLPNVLLVSSSSKSGLQQLQQQIYNIAAPRTKPGRDTRTTRRVVDSAEEKPVKDVKEKAFIDKRGRHYTLRKPSETPTTPSSRPASSERRSPSSSSRPTRSRSFSRASDSADAPEESRFKATTSRSSSSSSPATSSPSAPRSRSSTRGPSRFSKFDGSQRAEADLSTTTKSAKKPFSSSASSTSRPRASTKPRSASAPPRATRSKSVATRKSSK